MLLQIGTRQGRHACGPSNPTALQDVFFRIGGAAAGKATVSLEVNSDNTILDDVWAWRADHGNGVGWTVNTADTGVVVNGDRVTAYGLFVEHYQKNEVIWNGDDGRVVFFQNEMPYDPPVSLTTFRIPPLPFFGSWKIVSRSCMLPAGRDVGTSNAFAEKMSTPWLKKL